ncbi:hypothetical protein AML91_00080 [Paenibacillus jilunlii]|uniref:Uncharacterized protein n=1 Tax=Paenibacillus jilunlii TaxID=682956 RepID=A0ABR5T2A2_9BACL|nr:hypothetical protein AML91_00080 [Paenibacillus jilunlii]
MQQRPVYGCQCGSVGWEMGRRDCHGALGDAWEIAALKRVESLDFGLMDFVSGHHGAIPGAAMRSPGQFDHPLVARAKCDIAAAALASTCEFK